MLTLIRPAASRTFNPLAISSGDQLSRSLQPVVGHNPLSPAFAPAGGGSGQPGFGSLADQVAFELAQRGTNRLEAGGNGESFNFILGDLAKILKNIEQSTLGTDSADDFSNLFEDLDLTSSKLGATEKAKNDLVAKVLSHLDKIDFVCPCCTSGVNPLVPLVICRKRLGTVSI